MVDRTPSPPSRRGPAPGPSPSSLAASSPSAHPDLRSFRRGGLGWGPLVRKGRRCWPLFPGVFLSSFYVQSETDPLPFLPSLDYVSSLSLSGVCLFGCFGSTCLGWQVVLMPLEPSQKKNRTLGAAPSVTLGFAHKSPAFSTQ